MPAQARLHCLGPPRLQALGDDIALEERGRSEAAEVLLRIVAAGPGGASLPALLEALWPDLSPRKRRTRFDDCARCIQLLVGGEGTVLALEGDLVTVDPDRLEVDSLELERVLAPLLVPFQPGGDAADVAAARFAVSGALARDPVFLPRFDAPWARAARLRIADKLVRAARHFACAETA